MAVIPLRFPGLTADKVMTVDDRQEYEMAFQLHSFSRYDPLQEIVRRSLERGRDPAPYDRPMDVGEVVREIAVVGPVALNQAERAVEATHLAMLRQTGPASEHEMAIGVRDWIAQHGTMAALTNRLEQVENGRITIRYEPGETALERLQAVAEGVDRALARQHMIPSPLPTVIRDDLER